jgi:DNA-directed RNA polymerase specialized sigma24 family protein
MFDPTAPSSILALAELKQPIVMGLLRALALFRTRNQADAKDLLANSIVRVFDPADMPWKPEVRPFIRHMRFVMRRVWYRELRKKSTENEVYDGSFAQEKTASDDASTHDEVARKRALVTWRLLGDRVLARLGSDLDAIRLYALAKERDLDPAEEAAVLSLTVSQIAAARKRLRYHGEIVLREWTDSEARRMRSLRDEATKNEGETP